MLVPRCWLLIIGAAFCFRAGAQSCSSTIQFSNTWNCPDFVGAAFFKLLPHNQLIFGGRAGDRLTVFKTDSIGRAIWIKKYDDLNSFHISFNNKFLLDPSGNYLACFSLNNIMMLDTAGNPLKAVRLRYEGDSIGDSYAGIGDLQCMPNGDKILFAVTANESPFNTRWMLASVSADLSTVLWNTIMDTGEPGTGGFQDPTMKVDGDTLLVASTVGNHDNYSAQNGLLMSFHASNGQLIKKFAFRIEDTITTSLCIYPYNDGYIATAEYGGGVRIKDNHVILRLNKNFELLNTYKLQGIPFDQIMDIVTEPNGNFFGVIGDSTGIPVLFSVSSTDSILWARRNMAMAATSPAFLLKTSDGLVALTYNDSWGPGPYPFFRLVKTDMNGFLRSCSYDEFPLRKIQVNVAAAKENVTIKDANLVTLSNGNIRQESVIYPDSPTCFAVSTCDSVKIVPSNVNCSGPIGTFSAHRNAGCFTPVKWTISGGPIEEQEWNDSTINIKFLQLGQYKLKAEIQSCQLADSVELTIVPIEGTLNLGADTVICPGNTITLNAHAGFASYQWQDGSTDSIYVVTQPGTYFVNATDFCGDVYWDTVVIVPHPPFLFTAGPDRIKCNTDTLHLDASAGFLNYTWSNNYHISSLTGQDVIVSPDVDTSYFVKAEKTPGCFAFDTVHVIVYHSPQIFLGADTSFCSGDSIILKAPPGLTSYQWNTGSTSQQIAVKSAGSYFVTATSSNGCHSRDTMQVINVWRNPIVSLDKSTGLCFQSTRTLDAGAFQSYLWQDGSTLRTFVVTHLGDYSVQVVDAKNCKASDTVHINTILPLPAGFLPADTALCTYAVLNVSSKRNFSTYVWSNGSTGKTISILGSGSYWLQVRDINNCIGKDTINISPKACAKGVFIPNAFTPDHDGKDDVFRASVNGPIKSFELSVYNRWGQLVFDTKEWSKGWDGTLAGHAANTGTYVWICRYQFQGEIAHLNKGTVVLIR